MRYAKKVDANQPGIVKALRSIPGVTVELDHDDILVGRNGKTYWFEIKSQESVSKKAQQVNSSKIKNSQKRIKGSFSGHYMIVWSLEQILKEIGITP